ncbi:hypothetical protein BOTBODRAFT_574757 [Botryobasidium botryosum FD-172 SS1]|uniref:Uncharacterized protein n=1 Tax=Botryobasidium botryosum (strain FD-172 SS1) TaxID=930990 RepID=A0A067MZY9_BOTB1|nr:hypothetical protein BOTBODRAFT_574757 [Botryobasidium botryosum FD-172 SS1]
MWCTRWYLPLLFLPFPHASPFFLIVFLFSLTLHARPCLYCILLLVALFTSSCYWEPIPTSTLSIPPSALNLTYPELPSVGYSSSTLIRLVDRCWCDFGLTPFFDPFNNTRWEEVSLERDSKRRLRLSDGAFLALSTSPTEVALCRTQTFLRNRCFDGARTRVAIAIPLALLTAQV